MSDAAPTPPDRGEFLLDGRTVAFEPTETHGAIGSRLIIRPRGDDQEVRLLRRVVWFTPEGWQLPVKAYRADDPGMATLFRKPLERAPWAVPIALRNAQEVAAGSADRVWVSLFEQDVTRLTPLPARLHKLAVSGGRAELASLHRLFASACKSLADYADRINPDFVPARTEQARDQPRPGVPILAPTGFAADAADEVILLDAGFVLPHHDALRSFVPTGFKAIFPHTNYTFGLRCAHPHFDAIHSLAVILFFRQVVDAAKQASADEKAMKMLEETDAKVQAAQAEAKLKNGNPTLEELQTLFGGLSQLQQTFRQQADRFDGGGGVATRSKVKSPEPPIPTPTGPTPLPPAPPKPRQSTPWPRSAKLTAAGLGMLALAFGGLAIWLATRPKPQELSPVAAVPTAQPTGNSPLSEYVVLFPSQSVTPEQIQASLAEAFPNAPTQIIQADAAKRQQLLDERLQQNIKKVSDPGKARDLLTKLTAANVKFLGFDPDERDAVASLKGVINREGVFLPGVTPASPPPVPGSLLQPDAKDRLLSIAGLKDDTVSAGLLGELQAAVRDQTTYRELLNAIGDRTAVVVDTGKAPDVPGKLVSRTGPPVFAPRPGIAVYSAIDPKFEAITVTGDNSLSVPVPCHWRLVGERDRQGASFEGVSDQVRGQLLWAAVPANQKISWQSAGLERDGQTTPVASFDIAIPLPAQGKVAVFRNQTLYSDRTRDSVQTKVRTYLTKRIRLPPDQVATAFDVNGQSGLYVGTILYSGLAQAVANGPPGGGADVEVMSAAEFAKQSETENAAVTKPKAGDPKRAPKPTD